MVCRSRSRGPTHSFHIKLWPRTTQWFSRSSLEEEKEKLMLRPAISFAFFSLLLEILVNSPIIFFSLSFCFTRFFSSLLFSSFFSFCALHPALGHPCLCPAWFSQKCVPSHDPKGVPAPPPPIKDGRIISTGCTVEFGVRSISRLWVKRRAKCLADGSPGTFEVKSGVWLEQMRPAHRR